MKIIKPTAISVLAFLLGGIMSTHGQNLINGSFEIGTDPNASAGQNIGMTAPDSTTILGWTLSTGTIDYIGSRWVAGDGVRCIDLSGISAGTVFQTVSGFTPGMDYELSFLIAANPEGGPPTRSLQVDVGSASGIFSFTGPGTAADLGWARHTFDFTATAPALVLSFTSLENNAFGAALDGITIVPIPEPGSLSLCATAGAMFALARLCRRFRRRGQRPA